MTVTPRGRDALDLEISTAHGATAFAATLARGC
jgi:hypothetical protein